MPIQQDKKDSLLLGIAEIVKFSNFANKIKIAILRL